jgi:hypothetical protein
MKPTQTINEDIRRHPNGSFNFDFNRTHAAALRGQALCFTLRAVGTVILTMTGVLAVVFLVAAVCGLAQAANYEVGTSLVCDTQTQVERFIALFAGDAQSAIGAVNAEEHNSTACALINAAYLRGSHVGMARHGDKAFEIVRILVVGIDTAAGIQAVQPAIYFSLFDVKEYAV